MKPLKADIVQRSVTKSNPKIKTINALGGKLSFNSLIFKTLYRNISGLLLQTSFHKGQQLLIKETLQDKSSKDSSK